MQQLKYYFILFFLVCSSLSYGQSKPSDTTKILFIGNSYTYYNSSPELLKKLAQEKFPNKTIQVKLVSQGGMTLKRHWEAGEAQEAIKSNSWNYVILQEQSKLGMPVIIDNAVYFGQTELFFEFAKKFDEEIKASGAKTVFFMTWSTKDRPEQQEILTYAYSTIAKELNAIVAPIGLAWDKVRSSNQFNLYAMDGSHPSQHGSYLVATTLFATLFEENPSGLTGKILGHLLSSRGEPSLGSKLLINIPPADALEIQRASWEVNKNLQKTDGYTNIKEPKQTYSIPVLTKGENIDLPKITGRWYGTSTYGSNYLGQILDASYKDDSLQLSLTLYAADRQDRMTVKDARIETNQLQLTIIDSLRTRNSKLSFSLSKGQLKGISASSGNSFTQYNHWTLSRDNVQNNVDLEAYDQMMIAFDSEIEKVGYTKAAINHFKQYGALIDSTYIPEETYLNAKGYNFLRDDKVYDALNTFELAMTLYPQSVNTYDSYAEALAIAGQHEKALKILLEGYELAKRTGDENLPMIEANLKKLKQGAPISQEMTPPPPPQPPQPK